MRIRRRVRNLMIVLSGYLSSCYSSGGISFGRHSKSTLLEAAILILGDSNYRKLGDPPDLDLLEERLRRALKEGGTVKVSFSNLKNKIWEAPKEDVACFLLEKLKKLIDEEESSTREEKYLVGLLLLPFSYSRKLPPEISLDLFSLRDSNVDNFLFNLSNYISDIIKKRRSQRRLREKKLAEKILDNF